MKVKVTTAETAFNVKYHEHKAKKAIIEISSQLL
jgi:hypothetical protein